MTQLITVTLSLCFNRAVNVIGVKLNLKGKALFHPARLALTGRMSGPDIGDQIQLLKASEGRYYSYCNCIQLM